MNRDGRTPAKKTGVSSEDVVDTYRRERVTAIIPEVRDRGAPSHLAAAGRRQSRLKSTTKELARTGAKRFLARSLKD